MLYRVLLLLIALISHQAFADSEDFKPFVGFDTGFKRLKIKEGDCTLRHKQPHLSFYTGIKLTPYVGVEGGGHITNRKSSSIARTDSRGLHLTILGYYPFVKGMNLLAGIGVSHVTTTIQNGYIIEMQKALPRLLFGIEVPVIDKLNLRVSSAWNSYFNKQDIQHRSTMLYNLGFLYYY